MRRNTLSVTVMVIVIFNVIVIDTVIAEAIVIVVIVSVKPLIVTEREIITIMVLHLVVLATS